MANYTPETPGSEVEFDKPNISDCWSPQPVSGGTGGGSGSEIPPIAEADAGKYLSAGADQTAKWDNTVVFIDSEAAGIKWPDMAGTVVSAEIIAAIQDAFDNHKPLMVLADVAGIGSGVLTMTASALADSRMTFTGILYLLTTYGAVMRVDASTNTVYTSFEEVGVEGN